MGPTCRGVGQHGVEPDEVVLQVPLLVVAVGFLTLHKEGPRHGCGLCVFWGGLWGSSSWVRGLLQCSHLHTALPLSLERFKHHWLLGDPPSGFLAFDYACAKQPLVYQVLSGRWPKQRSLRGCMKMGSETKLFCSK